MEVSTARTRRRLIAQLRHGRADGGITQDDLAAALDVSRQTVVKLESAAPSRQLDTLIRALHLVGYELVAVPSTDPLALRATLEHGDAPARVDRRR